MSVPGLFVVGTDTGVGKTRIAAAIARGLVRAGRRVGVLKPVATGAERIGNSWRCDDADALRAAVADDIALERVVPFLFQEPLAPTVAAKRQGICWTYEEVVRGTAEAIAWWNERSEVLIIEGIGGLLTPLAERRTLADLAGELDYPLVVVARRGLGTLNHTLLTVECALRRGLRVAGVVLNDAEPPEGTVAEETNAGELARSLDGIAILGEFGFVEEAESFSIAVGCVDWYDRSS